MDRVRQIQGQSYGQRRPSLTAVLRRILEGYPDGGQILKELIQNADDAGATEVKFLFDSRENAFNSTSLIHPDLSKFQGPALYVYNNGLFKEKDWHGIEGIMQGNKRLDPLSAGRFGVGFNSVYHVTDLPSVVSDHFVAFLDPQETFFGAGETGRRFDLRDSLLARYKDQFAPYEDVLGCNISSGIVNGTLFRLPLRRWPSRVSVKPYSSVKVKALFQSIIEEAPILLLFLKNIETIRFYETTRSEKEKETFSISIKDSLKASIRAMRKNFIQIALQRSNKPYEMTYEMVLEECKNGKLEREHKYMVLNRVGSEDPRVLEISAQLHLLPWAGVAASLTETATGRVFSFLPLPSESDCRTGLSVHIHGTFGVTDNRRNLKWAGAECQNDDTAFWNNYLLTDAISKAYAHLIIQLTHSQYPVYEILPVVSSILPDLDRIQGHWKLLLEPFFDELADKPVFWTKAEGGKWIALKDAVLSRLSRTLAKISPEVRAAVTKCLIQANQPVVCLPEHALQAVDNYLVEHVPSVREITPAYVLRVLKESQVHALNAQERNNIRNPLATGRGLDWSSIDRNERIRILEFVMKDGDLEDLEGLPLLPLADKTFTEFRRNSFGSNPERAVFVSSRSHPQTLIPGNGSRFLDCDLNESILTLLKSVAINAKKQNTSVVAPTQLVFFAPFVVPGLLKESLPDEWRGDSVIVPWDPNDEQAGELWLKGLWSWLRTEFSNDLSRFEGVPLVPLTTKRPETKHLIKIKNNHSVIQGSSHFAALPRNVIGALQRAGCVVLSHIPMFCDHLDLRRHLEPPTPSGVLKVLSSIIEEEAGIPLSTLSLDEKRALRAFVSSLRNPSDDEIVTLMSLPIFEAVDGTVTSLQARGTLYGRKLDVAPPRLILPGDILVPESDQIISAADEDSYQLLRRLPVRILNMSAFLIEKVFPFIEKQTFYTRSQVTVLMTWVLNRLPVLSSENRSFPDHLKTLKFVPVTNNQFKAPCELFDPADEILKHLFDGEPSAFPSEEFSNSHTLSLLRVFLGLRRSRTLDGQDALIIAKQISDMPEEKAKMRAAALLNFLNENFYLMDTEVLMDQETNIKMTLEQALCRLQWLPVSRDPPAKYPSTMSWFISSQFLYSPSEMRDREAALLVGSTMPIVHVAVNRKLKRAFGWERPPPIASVLEQLQTAAKRWKGHAKKPNEVETLMFQTMVRQIYDYLSTRNILPEAIAALKSANFGPWVWCGPGFALPNRVAFLNTCPFDVNPYLCTMSEEFRKYSDLMLSCGVRESFGEEDILDVLPIIREAHLMKKTKMEVKHDLYLVTEILHWTTNSGTELPDNLKSKVFVPIQTADDKLCLKPLFEVSYCDTNIQEVEDNSFFNVAHESIPKRTLQLLGVQPLNRSLTFVETLGFEQSGPHEPVTTRLQNILKEYQDGVCLFKELIQNADDAGATEVKFLIDWRRNPCGKLLSPGMANAQGPALWVYNNAVFTDKDFDNINKLAGATKMESYNKIGRFGLGFCTTYNITDIPSFVSREFLVVFDPQTNHLGPLVKDKTRPGIRLNLKKNPKALVSCSDQFLPYHNVFECKMKNLEEDFFYDGTLFRFPLRTKEQAETSEISKKHYDETAFKHLVCAFRENASNLLLFVNNIKKITFYEMEFEASSDESPMKMLFELRKDIVETISRNSSSRSKSDSYLDPKHSKQSTKTLQESYVVSLESSTYPCIWFQFSTIQTNYQVWLASFSSGRNLSVDLSATEEGKQKGLVSQAGVAALLSSSKEKVSSLKPKAVNGEAFFSLPLSLETGLPVHVNGCFAVTTNRRGLWEDTLAEYGSSKPFEILWNQTLLEDAVSIAYVQLLEDLVKLNKEGKVGDFHFEVLWPDPTISPSKIWKRFVNSVYQRINDSSAPLMRSSSDKWVSIEEGVHLDEKLRRLPECNFIMLESGYQVVDLPSFAHDAYVKAGLKQELTKRTVTIERFLRDIFFGNISDFSTETRESVICYVLDEYLRGSTHFAKFLLDKCCIPTSPDGQVLVSPKSLIDPQGSAAELYSPNDRRFPFGDVISTEERLVVLRKLGMGEDLLSWQSICERAASIVKLKNDRPIALQRVRSLIKYLNLNLPRLEDASQSEVELLRSISFLPVLDQPAGYCIPWKGSYKPSKRGIAMLAPVNLYPNDLLYLLGTSKAILDDTSETGCGKLTPQCLKVLGIADKIIEAEDVLFQLSSTVQATRIKRTNIDWHCIREISFNVYRYLQDKLQTPERQAILEILQEKPWIFVDSKFVGWKQVAFDWNGHGDPFLYHLPQELSMEFRELFEACGVRKTFGADDYIEALFSFQERKQGQPLTQSEFKTTKAFLDEISELEEETVDAFYKHLPMPDSEQIMRPVGQLVVNDAPWLQQNDGAQFVHPDISTKLAHSLGAHNIRNVTLNKYSRCMGKPFGQVEHLTSRLKNILTSYPCDTGVLKEILQNSDDAQATEVHFVYDPRQHGTEHVLNENWKKLQGPALCVYNNRPFTDEDIEGIQRLGTGSKADDQEKTGQNGIGFNAVYHLTDCPSFISDGNTLCILDPHAQYAPDATRGSPGRLLEPLDFQFRSDFSDVLNGYLEDFFVLDGCTMFRFPLRTKAMAESSEISKSSFDDLDIERLLNAFETEAKEALLFLNSVRQITISMVIDNHLTTKCQVTASISEESNSKLQEMSSQVRLCNKLSTKDIPWYGVTYLMKISESQRNTEEWLIHQCLGAEQYIEEDEIPDGKHLGLLPYGGLAACVRVKDPHSKTQETRQQKPKHSKSHVFSTLPLPAETGLPVHVNGQFVCDHSRRHIWLDQEGIGARSEWNEFLKNQILAPAYVKLLLNMREHISGIREGNPWFFISKRDVHFGFQWYQSLFPDPDVVHTDWKGFVYAVFKNLALKPVLPVLKGQDEVTTSASPPSTMDTEFALGALPTPCLWMSPVSDDEDEQAYFSDIDENIEKLLLSTGFPLLFSSSNTFRHFKAAGVPVKSISPDVVIKFLRSPKCKMGPIPCSIKESKLKDTSNLTLLIKYLMGCKRLVTGLHGLPLLLTEDEILRRFDIDHPVFFTPFSDLVPKQKELFLHKGFVTALLDHLKDPIKQTGIFKRFDTISMEPYLVHLLPSSWFAIDKPIQWNPTAESKPSREWLTLLWKLIHKTFQDRKVRNKKECAKILRPLEDWPILPTSSETLVSITFGKTVLDLTSQSYENDKLVTILRKLGCAELDFSVLPGLGTLDISHIVSTYLAKPQSKLDLVSVLEQLMKEKDISGALDDKDILVLLNFLQEDVTTVYSHKNTLRGLPFFKTLNGKHVSLSNYVSAYILELPKCIPLEDIETSVEMEGCVLLEEIPDLDSLYKALDIYCISKCEVFVKYILPNLDAMTAESRESVLTYIRDVLLVPTTDPNERSIIIETLIDINILPDKSGELTPARAFYDPGNPVFKSMLPVESFPQGEFVNEKWLPLLREIGLKQSVTQQDFIEFAEAIASEAELTPSDAVLKEKSKALVTYLLEDENLHDASFLHVISQIKFVAAETASENLRNLYLQFESKNKDDISLYTAFHGAVSHECQAFLWSSVPLLGPWALPKGGENQRTLVESLGIEIAPPVDKVIKHLENLSLKYAGNVNKDTPKDQRELLHDVIYKVLGFFKTETGCPAGNPSEKCSRSCHTIGNILRKTPCIPVEEGRVFVQGNQLAFEAIEELPPFLYKAPREYGHLEHVLKRLGAEEKTTPIQYANVLARLKEVCKDKHMEPNEKRVARMASQGFFSTVSVLLKEEKEASVTALLTRINELYLPSKEGFLKLSNELIVYDDPSFERRASEYASSFVDIAREGELTADRLAHLFEILPPRLRAINIQSIIREELHPCSTDRHCIADAENDQCPFIARYRGILLSPKFFNGIIRVIKHQRQTANIPQEVRDQVHLLSMLKISCMGSVDTHLVNTETKSHIKNSKESQDCFLEEKNKEREIYIKHGTDENPLHIQLCFLINKITGNHIEKEIYLQAMFACRVPEDILPSLDRCGVAQDLLSSELRTTDPSLGSEIPVMYHYLLRQDLGYFFRQGEIVGYEKERAQTEEDKDDSDPIYVYAKVIKKVTTITGSTESNKIDLQARYLIDVGEPKLVEVSVLDLYKFDRSAPDFPTIAPGLSDLTDIMPFTGDPNSVDNKAATRNTRMEYAMKEIKEVLWEAWKLDDKGRKKVTKRLFLRWHPDKNLGCDIANEVMKFLLGEIERLERLFPTNWRESAREEKTKPPEPSSNFSDLFEKWNQRAHQEWETYNTFKRQKPGASQSGAGSPQRKEARRWMKQAKEDLSAAKCLAEQESPFYSFVCFLCQQSAEKAFKSALYSACGIAENQLETHDVLNLAYEITEIDGSPSDIAQLASKLKNYYEKTRYPHFHHGDVIPSVAFTRENAEEALGVAEAILAKIGEFIDANLGEEQL